MSSVERSESPFSPLSEAVSALETFSAVEKESFFKALDSLPNFDSPTNVDRYEIEEEDWKWLATAVGSRTHEEVLKFAQEEYDKLACDPELVRKSPQTRPHPPPSLLARRGFPRG